MMKRVVLYMFALAFVFSQINLSFAQSAGSNAGMELTETSPHCAVCEAAESQNFAKSAPGKIERGVVNILLGWTNLFAQPVQAGKSGGSVLSGIGNGFKNTIVRTVQGVVELGLFWLPPGHGEPLNHCALGDLGITGR